jgi:hypothetical protein
MSNEEKNPINKGVELMLRRVSKEPVTHGLKVNKSFTLQNKQFFLKFEFTWGNLT